MTTGPIADQALTIYQGEDVTVSIPIVDAGGDPVTVDGGTAFFHVFASPADSTPALALTEADGVGLSGSTASVTMTHAQTATLSGEYRWHLALTLSGSRSIVATGTVKVVQSSAGAA